MKVADPSCLDRPDPPSYARVLKESLYTRSIQMDQRAPIAGRNGSTTPESNNTQHSTMVRLLQLFVLVVIITATSFSRAHGRLVFTEIMIHPTKASNAVTVWFELYNTENTRISLDGWIVTSTTNEGINFIFHTIRTSRTVLPFDYFVMGNNADSATNGGIFVDFPIGLAPFRQDGTGRNRICIFPPNNPPGSGCQDVVRWSTDQPNDDYKLFPFAPGASLAKQNTTGDNTASNAASNWKASVANMNCVDGNDKGTPDKANSFECPLSPTKTVTKPPTKAPVQTTVLTKPPTKVPTMPVLTKPPTKAPTNTATVTKPPTKAPIKVNPPFGPVAPTTTKAPVKADPTTPATTRRPVVAPTVVVAQAPVAAPVLQPTDKKCGLFSLGLFCINGCGLLGRLLGLCED